MSATANSPAAQSALDSLQVIPKPKAIESRWYPVWESAGYFVPSGDASKPITPSVAATERLARCTWATPSSRR